MAKTKKKTIITRKDEVRIQTLDTTKMLNMYIADKVVKTWKEDFIDQDSGEVVTVERSEPLYVKAYLKMQDEQHAETAKKEGREHKPKTFSLLIEKAAPIPVGCFIPLEFSQVYAEQ